MITRIDKDLTLSPPVNNHSNTARELDIDSTENFFIFYVTLLFFLPSKSECL